MTRSSVDPCSLMIYKNTILICAVILHVDDSFSLGMDSFLKMEAYVAQRFIPRPHLAI